MTDQLPVTLVTKDASRDSVEAYKDSPRKVGKPKREDGE